MFLIMKERYHKRSFFFSDVSYSEIGLKKSDCIISAEI